MFEILTIQDSPNDVVEDIVEFFITEVEEGDDKDLKGFMDFFKNFKKGNGKFGKILFTELDEFAEKYEGDVESSTKPSKAEYKDSLETFAYSQYKVYDIIHDSKGGGFYVTDYDFDYEHAPTPGEAIWELANEWYAVEGGESDEVDLSYFFGDTIDGEAKINVPTEERGRQFDAQYPSFEQIKKCCIMQDFGSQTSKVEEMWKRVKVA